ncbi:MAG: hypothetical protein AB7T27_04145 [Kiritimatiellia bacterium]
MIKKNDEPGRRDVSVCIDQSDCFNQPGTFRCCPLGMQFYSDQQMEEELILEVALDIPGEGKTHQKVSCSGVVVQSVLDNPRNAYRNWVYFIDLAPGIKEQLQCFAKESKLLCPFCENF